MCAIMDAQVAHEVFGGTPSPAGHEFYKWIHKGSGRLVTGGKLWKELKSGSAEFRSWARQAQLAGLITIVDNQQVDHRTSQIEREAKHKSDDPHVLAVAQISGARLLFTNDRLLGQDFRNKALIDQPRGSVYHTRDIRARNDNKRFSSAHKRLLGNSRLCRARP